MEYIKKIYISLPPIKAAHQLVVPLVISRKCQAQFRAWIYFICPPKLVSSQRTPNWIQMKPNFSPNQHNTPHHTKGQQWKRKGKKKKTNINENHTTKEKNIEKKCKGLFGNISIISPRDTQTLTTHHPIY